MIKKIFFVLLIAVALPVFAGVLESAKTSKDFVFLYLYTSECGYCKLFNPYYNRISQKYNNKVAYLKINANTDYGRKLITKYRARYVPYVVIIDSKSNKSFNVQTGCLLDDQCLDKVVSNFIK